MAFVVRVVLLLLVEEQSAGQIVVTVAGAEGRVETGPIRNAPLGVDAGTIVAGIACAYSSGVIVAVVPSAVCIGLSVFASGFVGGGACVFGLHVRSAALRSATTPRSCLGRLASPI